MGLKLVLHVLPSENRVGWKVDILSFVSGRLRFKQQSFKGKIPVVDSLVGFNSS